MTSSVPQDDGRELPPGPNYQTVTDRPEEDPESPSDRPLSSEDEVTVEVVTRRPNHTLKARSTNGSRPYSGRVRWGTEKGLQETPETGRVSPVRSPVSGTPRTDLGPLSHGCLGVVERNDTEGTQGTGRGKMVVTFWDYFFETLPVPFTDLSPRHRNGRSGQGGARRGSSVVSTFPGEFKYLNLSDRTFPEVDCDRTPS